MVWPAPIERMQDGFRFVLPPEARALLGQLAAELEALLDRDDDPALERLFPAAYEGDAAASAEYAGLVGSDLREGRREAARVLRGTVAADTLSEDEAAAWLGAVNDLRLVLGTRLGVTEELYEQELDHDDPRAAELAVFFYLTWLQERMLQAMQAPAPGP